MKTPFNTLRYADPVSNESNAKIGALLASVSNNLLMSSERMSRQAKSRTTETHAFPDEERIGKCVDGDSDENDKFENCQTGSFEETITNVKDYSNFEEAFTSPPRMQYTQSPDSMVLDQFLGNDGATPESEPPATERSPMSSGKSDCSYCYPKSWLACSKCARMRWQLQIKRMQIAT